jgi:hypothetical protein
MRGAVPSRTRSTLSSSAATPIGNRWLKYRLPRVSSSPIGTSFCIRMGPSSRPLSGQKMLSPVRASPQMMGQLMELPPRWRGSSEGWYWMLPWVGMFSASSGTNRVT